MNDSSEIKTEVSRLGQELGRHVRLLHLLRTTQADLMPAGLDRAAFGVLHQLVRCGPSRQADLAEVILLDPSTVSRHVGQLVRQQLAERRPDPEDGRAVQLVATARGHAVADESVRRRNQVLQAALTGWKAEDVSSLTTLLSRLNDDLDSLRNLAARPNRLPPPAHATDPTAHADPTGPR
jgi:DNA-binding MarR family transcriptional regulator